MTEPTYVVVLKKINYHSGATVAADVESAVDKIMMRAPGNPREWEVEYVGEVMADGTVRDLVDEVTTEGPTEHVEAGAIAFT